MMHMRDACLQHFERRQGRPLAPEARQKIEKVFNTPANYVLSKTTPPFPLFVSPTNCFHSFSPYPHPDTPQHNQFYYRAERDLRGFLALDAAAARGNMAVRSARVAHCILHFALCIVRSIPLTESVQAARISRRCDQEVHPPALARATNCSRVSLPSPQPQVHRVPFLAA